MNASDTACKNTPIATPIPFAESIQKATQATDLLLSDLREARKAASTKTIGDRAIARLLNGMIEEVCKVGATLVDLQGEK